MAMVLPGLFAAKTDGFMAKVIPLLFAIATDMVSRRKASFQSVVDPY
jgi:hypothetical protein